MIYAQFNATNYKLEQRPVLTFSASETTFSEIVIDFTGKTASDLPIKYQEIKVIEDSTNPDTVLYYGYCSQPSLPAFNGTQERVLLTIELMSPQTYLTKRTIDILIKNVNIHDAVETILAGIVAHDGFTIESNDLPTTEYLSEYITHRTIESVLSNLGGRFGFIWYVDELKKIYLKDLSAIQLSNPVYSLTSPTATDLASVQPSFNVADYVNRLNFVNVNLISLQNLTENDLVLKDGESYAFAYPFSISESVVFRSGGTSVEVLDIITTTNTYQIIANSTLQTITYDAAIGFSGVDDGTAGKKILLERDSTNQNIITGFKFSGTTETLQSWITSQVTLKPTTMSYIDSDEISNNSTKFNTSGIIEKDIDANGKYYTYTEMTNYAKTLLRQNNKQADIVDLRFEGDDLSTLKALLVPTAKIYISLPNQFIDGGDYVITSGEYIIEQGIYSLSVQCRKASLSENYVDIFRKESGETVESQSQFITYYSQDEKTIISKKVIVDGEEVDV